MLTLSNTELGRYSTCQIPKIKGTGEVSKVLMLTNQILNLADTDFVRYGTGQILNLSDTEIVRHCQQIPSILVNKLSR